MRKQHDTSDIEWTLGKKILDPGSELPLFVQVAYLVFGVIAARSRPGGASALGR